MGGPSGTGWGWTREQQQQLQKMQDAQLRGSYLDGHSFVPLRFQEPIPAPPKTSVIDTISAIDKMKDDENDG